MIAVEPTIKLAFNYRGTTSAIVTLNGTRVGEVKFDSEFARDTFQQWLTAFGRSAFFGKPSLQVSTATEVTP